MIRVKLDIVPPTATAAKNLLRRSSGKQCMAGRMRDAKACS